MLGVNWGDFFFKVKQWLIFDGVFEMAPHPMYSIGYAGYYGASLITGSYVVFFASVVAHIMQFLFLVSVENPHIEKTYEKPPSFDEVVRINKEKVSQSSELGVHIFKSTIKQKSSTPDFESTTENSIKALSKDLIGINNFSLFRSVDFLLALLIFYGFIVPLVFSFLLNGFPGVHQILLNFATVNCVFWIIVRSVGIGFVLKSQSKSQWWTKWFIKRGESSDFAFQCWKTLYNTSIVMTYTSFISIAFLAYKYSGGTPLALHIYNNEQLQDTIFRQTIGFLLLGLQIWCTNSIYESIGSFGWYYGDYFVPLTTEKSRKLIYKGIYRYLNNPDEVIGQSAFFGLSLISGSWLVFALALLLQISLWALYIIVVAPHMKKIYGEQIRTDSGVTKSLKRVIQEAKFNKIFSTEPEKENDFTNGNSKSDNTIDNDSSQFGGFWVSKKGVELEHNTKNVKKTKKPGHMYKLSTSSITDFVNETRELFKNTKEKITGNIISNDAQDIENLSCYKFNLKKDGIIPTEESNITYDLGEPIYIDWEAPETHSRKDWIGIYKITSNFFSHISTVSSKGNYVYIHPDNELLAEFIKGDCVFTGNATHIKKPTSSEGDKINEPQIKTYCGNAVFSGDALPWDEGTYEMRLHHGTTHFVIATSKPFEIKAKKPSLSDENFALEAVSETFLKILNQCLSVIVTKKTPMSNSGTEMCENCKKKCSNREELNENCLECENQLFVNTTEIIEPLKGLDDTVGIADGLDEKIAKRLAGCIKSYFNMEYSYEVLVIAAQNNMTVRDVCLHIYNGRKALDDFNRMQTMSLLSPSIPSTPKM
ncbi:Phosphatidylethanolamine N-methyltransferase [Smittium culicis]|uniref:Phosphatidylethanolamine N-methyltransferase n=1 Tax=Smittium culicis TaxID=133412 RepID=A0A1R1WZW4_9FUNG|nr:Phosphatidylethanolamine N-methyltransferase [Smittium culicis]